MFVSTNEFSGAKSRKNANHSIYLYVLNCQRPCVIIGTDEVNSIDYLQRKQYRTGVEVRNLKREGTGVIVVKFEVKFKCYG